MSMQRAEQAEAEKGMRPPTKMLVDLKISGSTTEQFLQAPGVVAYNDKVSDQGIECCIECNDYLVHDFIAAVAGEHHLESAEVRRLQFPSAYQNIPHQSVIFHIEASRHAQKFSISVNDFYSVQLPRDFLWTRDCYASAMGWHIRRLIANRKIQDRSGGVFLAMNFLGETPQAKAAPDLWKQIIRWLDDINQPIIAPRRFLCMDAKRCAMLYAIIPTEETIMQWACLMANCRLYIGPDCLLSQLAYSLRVPSIVLSELPRNSYLDRHDAGVDADPLHLYCSSCGEQTQWSLDHVTDRYRELERTLLTESI